MIVPPGARRFSHEAMATVFEVIADHPDARYAAEAAQAAFDVVDRLERDLSRFLPNSDVGRINALTASRHTVVSPSTLECLTIARHLFDLTGGLFDVSVGTGLPSLEIDPDRLEVRAATDEVRIDLGGIGKGYAVDLMTDLLEEWELGRALVHGGFSSVLALAAPAGEDGWRLTLSDPAVPGRVLTRLTVTAAALGASGLVKGSHIVDPQTSRPASNRRAAWVVVPRPRGPDPDDTFVPRAAAVSDALATAFMLMDAGGIEALCESSAGLEAWVLHEPADGPEEEARLQRFGGASTGYTATSP